MTHIIRPPKLTCKYGHDTSGPYGRVQNGQCRQCFNDYNRELARKLRKKKHETKSL